METLLPKTKSERQREIDDAAAAHSRRLELDHWLDEKRLEQKLREVWELDS
ncbi:hypothetical protein ACGTNG_12715 [Halomonas sp. 1390]|uniref:hypothetical protein n=1 Tax=Halomonas sp. B23F22_3 TaxID=3459516 RepID=UPI00373FA17B